MELLDKIDKVSYKGQTLTNILRRVKPIQRILNRIDMFYPYTIKEGERADTIAYDYYGSSEYTWLIYITNNIYDPYYDWPLTHNQMIDYLTEKYGDYFETQVTIAHYKNDQQDYVVTPFTFQNWTVEQRFGWYPVTIYQSEVEINEKKREIRLIANKYLDQINQQISALFDNT